MKKKVTISPYTVELEEEQRITHVRVVDEFGKQAARANWNKAMGRWDGIHITVKKMPMVHELITVFDTLITEEGL